MELGLYPPQCFTIMGNTPAHRIRKREQIKRGLIEKPLATSYCQKLQKHIIVIPSGFFLLQTSPLRAWLAKYNLTSRLRRDVSSFIARSSAMVPEILLIACCADEIVWSRMATISHSGNILCWLNVA